MTYNRTVDSLVSIITPAYNSEKYIKECIESVMEQTYQKWEMIIVNDKSTDNTRNIVEVYAQKDSRIILHNQEFNSGAAAARNKAIELAKGRYIAFLDSDDTWKPEKLEKQLDFMKKNNYSFTFTSYEIIPQSHRDRTKVFRVPTQITYEQYLRNTIIGCLTVMMDRSVMGEIRVEKGHLEDVLTWMKYLKQGYTAYGLDENLSEYRIVPNSVSNNKFKNAARYFLCLRERQRLSLVKSVYCFLSYIFNAIKKRWV